MSSGKVKPSMSKSKPSQATTMTKKKKRERQNNHVQCCSAINCTHNRFRNKELSFFRFPKDEDRCMQWVINSQREDLLQKTTSQLYTGNVMCQVHFQDSQFTSTSALKASRSRKRLLVGAVPTLFNFPNQNLPSKLKAPTTASNLSVRNRRKMQISSKMSDLTGTCAALKSKVPQKTKVKKYKSSTLKRLVDAQTKRIKRMRSNANQAKSTRPLPDPTTISLLPKLKLTMAEFQRNKTASFGGRFGRLTNGSYCIVWGCSNRQKRRATDWRMHRFPLRNSALLSKWIKAVGQDGFEPSKVSRICSEHFKTEDYSTSDRVRRLKRTAVPSIFNVQLQHQAKAGASLVKDNDRPAEDIVTMPSNGQQEIKNNENIPTDVMQMTHSDSDSTEIPTGKDQLQACKPIVDDPTLVPHGHQNRTEKQDIFMDTAMNHSHSGNTLIQMEKKQVQCLLRIIKAISRIDFKLLKICFDEALYPDAKEELDTLICLIQAIHLTLETDFPGSAENGHIPSDTRLAKTQPPLYADVEEKDYCDDVGNDEDDSQNVMGDSEVSLPETDSPTTTKFSNQSESLMSSTERRKEDEEKEIGAPVAKSADQKDEIVLPMEREKGEKLSMDVLIGAPGDDIVVMQTSNTMGEDRVEVANIELIPCKTNSQSEPMGEAVVAEGQSAAGKVSKGRFMCEHCGKVSATKAGLSNHKKTHNADSLGCKDCGKQFVSRADLRKHRCPHSSKPKADHLCSLCGKCFWKKTYLSRHIRQHTGEKKYHCNSCSASFQTSGNLSRHTKIHTGEKPYKCNVCDRRFIQKINLVAHIGTYHTEEKPFPCTHCDKRYPTSLQLRSHVKLVHEGHDSKQRKLKYKFKRKQPATPQSCHVCEKMFSCNQSLKNHMAMHAGTVFTCSICNKTLGSKNSLQMHLHRHKGERPHTCSVCNRTFVQKAAMQQHMWTHRSDKRFNCQLCDKGYNEKRAFLSHAKTHGEEFHATLKDNLTQEFFPLVPTGDISTSMNACSREDKALEIKTNEAATATPINVGCGGGKTLATVFNQTTTATPSIITATTAEIKLDGDMGAFQDIVIFYEDAS